MKTEKPDVQLTYKPKNGVDKWHMKVGNKPEKGPGEYDKLVVGQGDDGIFVFEIKTNNIGFDPANPIEIKTANGAPGMPGQFITKVIDEDTLVVADPNIDQVATEYYYQLNFVDTTLPIEAIPPLDPIITNGCCKISLTGTGGGGDGLQLMSGTGVAVVLFAAAVLAILGNLIWRRFF